MYKYAFIHEKVECTIYKRKTLFFYTINMYMNNIRIYVLSSNSLNIVNHEFVTIFELSDLVSVRVETARVIGNS